MFKVKQCCHSDSQTPKFTADVNDSVLVIRDKRILGGKILRFPTTDSAEVLIDSGEILIVTAIEITAVMIDD